MEIPGELQRTTKYYLGARQGLSWEEIDLRAIMKFSPILDSLQGGCLGLPKGGLLVTGARLALTAQSHSALGSWCTHH